MALAPVNKLKKNQIVWLANHYCKHGHTYLTHYTCFLTDYENQPFDPKEPLPIPHRVGYFDIETSNLNADYGIILAYCIKPEGEENILQRVISPSELKTVFDEKVVKQCVADLKQFDRVVTHYGSRFDLKFIRTRAIVHKIPFLHYQDLLHTDTYYIVRNKFKLHSNRLENACNVLTGSSNKTHLDPIRWNRAMTGDKEALDYILQHCRYDVQDLERLYVTIRDFAMQRELSI